MKEDFEYYEQVGWVTGGSSPRVENFKILKETKTNKGTWEYEVQFTWKTSGEPTGTTGAKLTVKQDGQNWYISQIHNDDNDENRMEGEGDD